VQAADDLRAANALGVHFGTFPLADDGETEPLEDLARALEKHPRPFWTFAFGEGRELPALPPRVDPVDTRAAP